MLLGMAFALEDLPDALPWGAGAVAGALLGLLSLLGCLLLVRLALAKRTTATVVTTVVSQLVGFPTLWFGGPWATTALVKSLEIDDEFRVAYIVALFVSFFVPLLPLIVKLSIRTYREA